MTLTVASEKQVLGTSNWILGERHWFPAISSGQGRVMRGQEGSMTLDLLSGINSSCLRRQASSVLSHWIMKYIHVFHPADQPLAVQICSWQI